MTQTNVFFSASKNVVIDQMVEGGLSYFARENLEQIRARYPDAEVLDLDTAVLRMEEKLISQPIEITHEQYWDGLEQLPPMKFTNGKEATTFMMVEMLSGIITGVYVQVKDRYFCFNDRCTMQHADIVNKVKLSFPQAFA